ncbi:hypothetical protein BDW71DRAFT_26012 [Aspergillus fruticulosus]
MRMALQNLPTCEAAWTIWKTWSLRYKKLAVTVDGTQTSQRSTYSFCDFRETATMESIADQAKALASGTGDATRKHILDSLSPRHTLLPRSSHRHIKADFLYGTQPLYKTVLLTSNMDTAHASSPGPGSHRSEPFSILAKSREPLAVENLAAETGAAPLLLDTFLPWGTKK